MSWVKGWGLLGLLPTIWAGPGFRFWGWVSWRGCSGYCESWVSGLGTESVVQGKGLGFGVTSYYLGGDKGPGGAVAGTVSNNCHPDAVPPLQVVDLASPYPLPPPPTPPPSTQTTLVSPQAGGGGPAAGGLVDPQDFRHHSV